MYSYIVYTLVLCLNIASYTTQVTENNDSQDQGLIETSTVEIEVDGLIVDETQTKLGRDFYDLFYSNWVQPEGTKDFSIIISEKPLPRTGTQVSIEIHENIVFVRFLQPRYDAIEETAVEGVDVVSNYLKNYVEIKKNLESEDLQGSGI